MITWALPMFKWKMKIGAGDSTVAVPNDFLAWATAKNDVILTI
jgi:hypothetical protein